MRAAVFVFAVTALAACARSPMPARPLNAAPPAPAGVDHEAGTFETAGGTVLFEQCWRPADGPPRSVVVVVHGIKDHSSRYQELALHLVRAGHAACGFDHRGHGRSAGPRFDLHDFDAVLGDIDRYLGIVRGRFPRVPVFLYGHSMGGVISTLHAIERPGAIAGVILSAPALRLPIHPIEIAALLLVAKVLPHAPLLDAPDATFSPDPDVVEGMRDDPFIARGKGTGRMAAELARGIRRVWAGADRIETPILILAGADDRAADSRGSVELHRQIGSPNSTLRVYPDAGHDLANDPKRAEIFADLERWLGGRSLAREAEGTAQRRE